MKSKANMCLIKNGIDYKNIKSKNKITIGREWGMTWAAMSSWVGGWFSDLGQRRAQYIKVIVISITIDVSNIITYHFQLIKILYLDLKHLLDLYLASYDSSLLISN